MYSARVISDDDTFSIQNVKVKDTFCGVDNADTKCIIKNMNTWQEKLLKIMDEKNLVQEDIAEILDCSRGYVGHLLKARRGKSVSVKLLKRLAVGLKLPSDYFIKEIASNSNPITHPSSPTQDTLQTYPLLESKAEITNWVKMPVISNEHEIVYMPPVSGLEGKPIFVYKVSSTAMISPHNAANSLYPDDVLYIDPTRPPQVGNIVLIGDENSVLLRQYQKDGDTVYFKAFDHTLPVLYPGPTRQIIGVAILLNKSLVD